MNKWMAEGVSEWAREQKTEKKKTHQNNTINAVCERKYCNVYYSNTISHTHSREIDGIQKNWNKMSQ